MKKLFFKLSLLLPIPFLIGITNMWIDPIHLLSNEYYAKAALLLADNSIKFDDCDERKLISEFIKNKKSTDILILGSSRSAIIDSACVGSPILNLSISAALLEDMIGIYGLYSLNHAKPKKIVIGIDPWVLNGSRSPSADFYFNTSFNYMVQKMGMPSMQLPADNQPWYKSKYLNVISFEYFQHSLSSIMEDGFRRVLPEICTTNDKNCIKQADGVLDYPKKWQSDPQEIQLAVERELSQKDFFGTADFINIDEEKLELLTKFISSLQEQQVEVVLFLSPYHPRIWDKVKIEKKYEAIIKTENVMKEMGQKQNISIIGSFNPYIYKLQYLDFHDAVHANRHALEMIFEKDKKNSVKLID
jgi:hypothetical protein